MLLWRILKTNKKCQQENIHPNSEVILFFLNLKSQPPPKSRRLLLHLETEFLKTHQHLFINRIAIRHEFQSPPLHRRAPWPPKPAPAPLLPTGSLTVTFSWGNVEEREGRADFAYIIIIFKTQSASRTDKNKTKQSNFHVSHIFVL